MKFHFYLLTSLLLSSFICDAQVVSKDSLNILERQKNTLQIGKQLNEHKLKLAKLENSLEKQSAKTATAQKDAQEAANANAEIAAKLSGDPSDKKLSRQARKAARRTERCATHARKEASNLEGLQEDISSLKKQIADDESKLAAMPMLTMPVQQ